MPQLVFKIESKQPGIYRTIEHFGEYNTNDVIVPRIGERVLFLDSSNLTRAYKVVELEYVYAMVLGIQRLYHILIYVEHTSPIDEVKYVVKTKRRTNTT